MSKFPAIPEFNDLQSAMTAMRAMKDIVEQLAGLRQGTSRGAPQIFVEASAPVSGRGVVLSPGDFWIEPGPPAHLYYWTGSAWQRVVS